MSSAPRPKRTPSPATVPAKPKITDLSQPPRNIPSPSNPNDSLIDIMTNSPNGRKKTQSWRQDDLRSKCPCKKSSAKSWLLQCTKCKQNWHSNCCNLKGISQKFVEELDHWLCPYCFAPPMICSACQKSCPSANAVASKLDVIQDELSEMSNMKDQLSQVHAELVALRNRPSITTRDLTQGLNDLSESIRSELQSQNIAAHPTNSTIAASIAEIKKSVDSLVGSSPCETPASNSTLTDVQPDSVPLSFEPFSKLQKDVLQSQVLAGVTSFLDTVEDKFDSSFTSRKVIYFGDFGYKYQNAEHKPAPIPPEIKSVIDVIKSSHPDLKDIPNSCLITLYESGENYCPLHSDDELFISPSSDIFTLSLGHTRVMQLRRNSDKETRDIMLENNSLLTFSRASQDCWKHSILADPTISERRYSLTFRSIAPFNINSTVIVGDSNTQDLVFGHERGSFGRWLPGKRIKASRIQFIPEPQQIGPHRNLVLNVGINDINRSNRKSTRLLIGQLESKCKRITEAYPKMRIFISLLLPTKDFHLNLQVLEFNEHICDLIEGNRSLHVIRHESLTDQFGRLDPAMGRMRAGRPDSTDFIHLGGRGICEFVRVIKNTVIYNRKHRTPRDAPRSAKPQTPQPPPPGTSPGIPYARQPPFPDHGSRGPRTRSGASNPWHSPRYTSPGPMGMRPPSVPSLWQSPQYTSPGPMGMRPPSVPSLWQSPQLPNPLPRPFDGNYRGITTGTRSGFPPLLVNDGFQR